MFCEANRKKTEYLIPLTRRDSHWKLMENVAFSLRWWKIEWKEKVWKKKVHKQQGKLLERIVDQINLWAIHEVRTAAGVHFPKTTTNTFKSYRRERFLKRHSSRDGIRSFFPGLKHTTFQPSWQTWKSRRLSSESKNLIDWSLWSRVDQKVLMRRSDEMFICTSDSLFIVQAYCTS